MNWNGNGRHNLVSCSQRISVYDIIEDIHIICTSNPRNIPLCLYSFMSFVLWCIYQHIDGRTPGVDFIIAQVNSGKGNPLE